MAERPTRAPEIPTRTLGGLNERPSPANLQNGEFDVLEGLYPSDIGLLSRIPGKVEIAEFGAEILQIHQTNNSNGDILIQAGSTLYVSTLNALLGRATTPNLVFSPTGEEELMSQCIIVQQEATTVKGGSANGVQTIAGTETANTFYGRRLTDKLIDADGIVTFTASTGGGGSISTEGTFALAPGTYRISVQASYVSGNSVTMGLYNVTSGAFEVYSGTSVPVIATTLSGTTTSFNDPVSIKATITVVTTTKIFSIRHQCGNQTDARDPTFCGKATTASATVNGAAPKNLYCWIEILKTA